MVAMPPSSSIEQQRHDLPVKQLMKRLLEPHHLRPLLLVLGQWTLNVLNGGMVISAAYASVVFSSTSGGPYQGALIVAGLRLVAGMGASSVLERFSRRSLQAVSAAVSGLGCAISGVFFHWREALAGHDWMVTLGMALLAISEAMISPICHILSTELLPNIVRVSCTNICNFYGCVLAMVVVFLFPMMMTGLGEDITFWIFAGFGVIQAMYSICMLPETRGKSLEQIQQTLATLAARTYQVGTFALVAALPENRD